MFLNFIRKMVKTTKVFSRKLTVKFQSSTIVFSKMGTYQVVVTLCKCCHALAHKGLFMMRKLSNEVDTAKTFISRGIEIIKIPN